MNFHTLFISNFYLLSAFQWKLYLLSAFQCELLESGVKVAFDYLKVVSKDMYVFCNNVFHEMVIKAGMFLVSHLWNSTATV